MKGLQHVIGHYIGKVSSEFFSAYMKEDSETFFKIVIKAGILISSISCVISVLHYLQEYIVLFMRKRLTDNFHKQLFTSALFQQKEKCQDFDQIVCNDVEQFAVSFAESLDKLIYNPILISFYGYLCWGDSDLWSILHLIIFISLGSVIVRLAMHPLIKLTIQKKSLEGTFRYATVMIRKNAESIVLSNGQAREKEVQTRSLHAVLRKMKKIAIFDAVVKFFNIFIAYYGAIIPYVVVATARFNGKYDGIPVEDLPSKMQLV